MFSDCGSWKNFHDLEDSLTLEELAELFDIAVEKQNRFAKLLAAMNGVELEDSDSVKYSSEDVYTEILSVEDLVGLEYGLGYAVAD